MRQQLWNNFCNEKFKAFYLETFNSALRNIDITLNFIVAFATSATVASWAIWKHFEALSAAIVGISQFIVATKPFYPYLRDQKRLIELELLHSQLAFDYEKLWVKSGKEDEKSIERELNKLREYQFKSMERFHGVDAFEVERWRTGARKNRNSYLKLNYQVNV